MALRKPGINWEKSIVMKVNFIRENDGNLIRSREMSILPPKDTLIKLYAHRYHIDEIMYDLETNTYSVYMFEL